MLENTTQMRTNQESRWPQATRQPKQSATGFVYDYLKECIVSLVAAPGELITEKDVTEILGVSRTPVREAFMRLDGENLMEVIPRRGALVAPITLQHIRELAETRFVLEGHAVRVICQKRLDVEFGLKRLVTLQSEQYGADKQNVLEMIKTDRAFHTTIVDSLGNSELSKLYRSLGDRQLRSGIALFKVEPNRKSRAIDFHGQIVRALASQSEAEAISILEQHLLRHLDGLTALL
jgi:DNA-binding GntR family transcriptional regulator